MPPLEAMACGCPAIVADTSSLPEVVGNEGITFEVLNENDLADKVNALLADDERYKKYSLYGLKQVKYFTWDRLAQQTIHEYENFFRK
ncbi:Capsular glucan synthase [compost metagenome]